MAFGTVKKKREAGHHSAHPPRGKDGGSRPGEQGRTDGERAARLGGLRKHLATKFQHKRDAIDEVLVEIKNAILRLDREDGEGAIS